MAQKTNLNVTPYFDDFDPNRNYYKVLFNPGRPVQTRELNTLQSILQNQIETFGSNIFKEGSVVVPGNIVYDGNFFAVKLNPLNFGVDIRLYIDRFVGKKITGQSSGISASIQYVELPNNIDIAYTTLFVKYINSDSNNQFNPFIDGETLFCSEDVTYGNTTITTGTSFASLISNGATATGSAVSIGDGVYFIRGTFVKVNKETLVLEPYENNPSYRIGLKVSEDIVTANDDSSLYDNAKGFTNFAAPGADRLKISTRLSKKSLDDFNDTDFIELLRVKNGRLQKVESKTQYNIIKDYLAQRTYDESGDYTVSPFQVSIHNSLNNRLGNDGLFFDGENTEQGNTPSDDLMSVKVSPGKAYVRGYDVEKISTTILDVDKPRDTQNISNVTVPFEMGNIIRLDNANGSSVQKSVIYLQDSRKNSNTVGSGETIGVARVYNYSLTDATYTSPSTSWDLFLFDVQTYTKITLNSSVSGTEIPSSSYIKGKSSGASGYVVYPGNGTNVYLRQTSGTFIIGEQIIINGAQNIIRTITEIRSYDSSDIKSVYQSSSETGLSTSFTADSILYPQRVQGFSSSDVVSISPIDSGIATVTAAGKIFSNIKVGSIIRYSRPGFTTSSFNKVTAISIDGLSMTITGVSTVVGVCDGGISDITISTPFSIVSPSILNEQSGHLYSILPNSNVSSVNLDNSLLTFTAQSNINTTVTGGTISLSPANFNLPAGLSTALFQSFDAERYSIHYSDGSTETLTSDKVNINSNQLVFAGISNKQISTINATFIKTGIQSKLKTFNRSKVVNINLSKYTKSGSGISSSINDGLSYNQYYGLRVQDEEISLNYPDVVKVISVYESLDSFNPTLDQLSFSALANISENAIVGENIIGSDSKSIARIVSKPIGLTNNIEIVYLNASRFIEGETIIFEESNIVTTLNSIVRGKYKDVTNDYQLDKGQKNQYYDYSKIIRNSGVAEPSRRLIAVFDYYSVPSSDNGDAFTVLSYGAERYNTDIPFIGSPQVKSSDTIDFRPYVPVFTGASTSPFDFSARTFGSTLKVIPSPGERSILGYSFYLPRIDKIYLNKLGEFYVEKGISSTNPKSPILSDDVMEVASILLPAYLYSPRDARLVLVDNRRYTMRDIGKIENRVENLERVTSLSLLELNTATLQIQDANNLNRFRTGFFVDDFRNSDRINLDLSFVEVDTDSNLLTPIISKNSLANQLIPANQVTDENLDLSTNFQLLDSNVQKTGKAVTLKYESVGWIEQPLATRVENVNPFHVVVYTGRIVLSPERDTWVRTIQLDDRTVFVTNERSRIEETRTTEQVTIAANNDFLRSQGTNRNFGAERRRLLAQSPVVTSTQNLSVSSEQEVSVSIANALQSTVPESYMRSRNTEFSAVNLRPNEKYYQFLDGNSQVRFIPKLLEIATDSTLSNYGASGAFTVGETVIGSFNGRNIISFRVSKSNHKSGSFSTPDTVYTQNPYATSEIIPEEYSQSSKILNIDVFSLSQEAQGKYSGYLVKGAMLVGQTSGSVAYVKDLKLIADNYGSLVGSFFLENPNTNPPPAVRIGTGTKTFKLTSSPTNESSLPGSTLISSGESNYISEGTIEYYQRTITQATTNITTLTVNNVSTETTFYDPLAQSFVVGGNIEAPNAINVNEDINGAYLTAVEVYFARKDLGTAPVTCEIRTIQLGTPTRVVLGEPVTLNPEQVITSSDASVGTIFTFPYPIFLPPGQQYAIVLLAPESDQYEVWIAEMGENTVNAANLPDPENVRYTRQFAIGRLYKSQNGAEWTPNDYQDMKFKLYKANFTSTSGTVFFHNTPLDDSNGYVDLLQNNAIVTIPREVKIGITTTTDSNIINALNIGRKIGENQKDFVYGYISALGSPVSTVGITKAGQNYVNDTLVSTYNITGKGTALTLNITATNGAITGAVVVDSGNGYQTGDVVGIVTSSVSSNTGSGALFTISAQSNTVDTLYLTNFVGEGFTADLTSSLVYYGDSNNRVSWASTIVWDSTPVGGIFDGSFIKIDQLDHGMYAANNKLVISNAISNLPPVEITSPLTVSATSITVSSASTTNFGTFEGMPVSSINPGYLKVNNEIVKYESVSSNGVISGLTRGTDNTVTVPHSLGSLIYKYELNGISLRRINTTHDISDIDIGIDGYYIEIDRTSNNSNIDRSFDRVPPDLVLPNSPLINFNNFGAYGGNQITATKNILYTSIVPAYQISTPGTSTGISARIRTVSGTSVSGNEVSFIDRGFENIQLNRENLLSSARLVCSRSNETIYLSSMPRNKSLITALTLTSTNPTLSPLVFTNNSFSEFRYARFNNPITDYAGDSRVNSLVDDPNASYYISNTILLEQPSTSLRVIVSAYRHASADIRVLYNLIRPDSSEIDQTFELFPGYNNLTIDNNQDGFLDIVDASKNSGLSDINVTASTNGQFKEYQYTAYDIGPFTGFTIKIILAGTNQAFYPIVKDLRAIALA
jgi:hypothetical protein